MRALLLCALFAVTSGASLAQSQAIYRCGAGGRVLQQVPCDAPAPSVGPATAPSIDEQAAAQRIQRLQAAADRMERDRLAREARDLRANARAAGIDSRPRRAVAPPAPSPKKAKPHKRDAAGSGNRVAHARAR
jgi:hypothetical protein